MEDYLQYKTFRIKEKITEEKVKELVKNSISTHGIDKLSCARQVVSFIYNPYEISEQEIIDWLSSFGLTIKKSKENWFKARLAKLAKDNKETLGNQRLDCCDLNN